MTATKRRASSKELLRVSMRFSHSDLRLLARSLAVIDHELTSLSRQAMQASLARRVSRLLRGPKTGPRTLRLTYAETDVLASVVRQYLVFRCPISPRYEQIVLRLYRTHGWPDG